jgi:hypothetical protein
MKRKLSILLGSIALLLVSAGSAYAATLQLTTARDTFAIGDRFTVDIKIDSEDTGVNAAQGTIQIAKDVLEIVSVDKTGSVFNFWLTEPTFSNETGQVNFIGGSTSGFSGKSLQIIKVTFKVKGTGKTDIVFTDGAVTASDGSGTNVLSSMKGLSIVSAATVGMETITPRPTQITRPAAKATGLPVKPQVQVALYPDPQKWYNVAAPFGAQWNLPSDITDVATVIDKNPAGEPMKSEGLFDNKQFATLGEGIWYLHVQFRNNVGWGPVVHHRIAIDTMPPAAFPMRFDQGTSTDNPTPTVHFQSGDPSGVARYYIQIDSGARIEIKPDAYTLPAQEPGEHTIRIGAEDNAGNATEDRAILQIIPIASPVIVSVNKDVYIGEDNFQISGTTPASTTVRVLLKGAEGQILADMTARPDDNGNWHEQLTQGVPSGSYYFEIRAVDGRGALSLPVRSGPFSVSVKPFLIIGGLALSIGWFFGLIILLLLVVVGGGWLLWQIKLRQQSRKILICQRDISNMLAMVKKDIDRILEKYGDDKIDETEVAEIKHLAKRISEGIEKSGKYCIESVGEINK